MAASASHVLQSGDFGELHFHGFFPGRPKRKVVDVLLQLLAAFDGRALPFPSLLFEVLSLAEIECSPQPTVQVLNDAEILLLNS